jgi:hypothetical protein
MSTVLPLVSAMTNQMIKDKLQIGYERKPT